MAEFLHGSIVTFSSSERDPSSEEGTEKFKSFLPNLKKCDVSVPPEIFVEISKPWQELTSEQGKANGLVSYDQRRLGFKTF